MSAPQPPPGANPVPFMAALDVHGRRCVVIGGDAAAAAKVDALLQGAAQVVVIAPRLVPELLALAEANRVQWLARAFTPGDLDGAFLAVTVALDRATQERVWCDAREHSVLLNTLDEPKLCDFFAPALVRRGRLQLAISTGGDSPFLAAALRERLERIIGPEWGELTGLMGTVRRRLRRKGAPIERQRRAYRRLLRPDVRALLRHADYARVSSLASSLSDADEMQNAGRVQLVGAGPGEPLLLTQAALDALASADLVLHDALVSPSVLRYCSAASTVVAVGKRAGRPHMQQHEINALMIDAARAGVDVVRLKGGDPMLFARGGEEIAALRDAGIGVEVVPGVSSVTAAAAAAGIPLTHRGVASTVALVTAQDADGAAPANLEDAARSVDTLVVLMPLARLDDVGARLTRALDASTPCALISRATLPDQAVHCTQLGALADRARFERVESPALLIVGDVVRQSPAWNESDVSASEAVLSST